MSGPPEATAAVRLGVRRALRGLAADELVLAAVSGGADSLALAAALAVERPGSGALVVDHGLQPGSARVAARAAEVCRSLGLAPERLAPIRPASIRPASIRPASIRPASDHQRGEQRGEGGGQGGPEAAARRLRYRLLDEAADRLGATAVLLGHTLDDQAETVLLGLARGAGTRSLAGMAVRRGLWRRPLLGVTRRQTRAACAEAGLEPWDDPHNADPSYARVRVRGQVLPALELALGPGVAQALARTASQAREDADALDALTPDTDDVALLAALPPALLARAVKRWAEQACGGAVTGAHVDALRALVEAWRGQGPVALPGGVQAGREGGRLRRLPCGR